MTTATELADRQIAVRCQHDPEPFIARCLADRDWPTLSALCRIPYHQLGISQWRHNDLIAACRSLQAWPAPT